ncbi:Reticulon [Arabidopsis suecica]|uniref:Reticulon-like protein n=1 Tax=Arabidopsis suecica TaxID=45249 RepID=A0A8T1XQW7_ARASU|nr:Reticulon [Arabidopsis suecica]KAG7536715.1 Reticulon [Arabidopsis suecica]KAG7536719.1 Reticulon [Arabidopsis suecica]
MDLRSVSVAFYTWDVRRTKRLETILGLVREIATMEESVHQSIRFGSVADLIMWKNRRGGFLLLGSTTLLWFLFEKYGYSFFPFVVNTQLLLVVILFLWAKSAILFNRPMPQLPNLEISEASVFMVADTLRVWINTALAVAREIYMGRNAKQLFRVSVVLWTVSFVGNFLNFLTILYLGEYFCFPLFFTLFTIDRTYKYLQKRKNICFCTQDFLCVI